MNKKKIHPIYFKSFVGTWKRASLNGVPSTSDYFIKFNKDCTFEEIEGGPRDPVNGNVDEVSVEGDGEGHEKIFKKIKGRALLIKDSSKMEWHYRLEKQLDSIVSASPLRLTLITKQTQQVFAMQNNFSNIKKGKKARLKVKHNQT